MSSSPPSGGAKRGADGQAPEPARGKRHKSGRKLPKDKRVGNFRSYYSYRLGQRSVGELELDPRLSALDKAWFCGRRGLDIGCNSGELTIAIARRLEPASLLGIEVDPELVSRARANLREAMQQAQVLKAFEEIKDEQQELGGGHEVARAKDDNEASKQDGGEAADVTAGAEKSFADEMPLSFRLWKSPVVGKSAVPKSIGKTASGAAFPLNLVFKREDVIKDSHSGRDYDFVTCFSVTKWIHLFHGDEGIKTLFQRIYEMLSPGGRFVFEPQPWKSYHKRKFTSAVTSANYDKIDLRPKDFPRFLIESVGFRSCEFLQVCQTSAKGFRRPVYVAQK